MSKKYRVTDVTFYGGWLQKAELTNPPSQPALQRPREFIGGGNLSGGSGLCFLFQSQLPKASHVPTDGDSVLSDMFHRTLALVLEEPKPVLLGDLLIRGAGHNGSFASQFVRRPSPVGWLGAIVFHRMPHAEHSQ